MPLIPRPSSFLDWTPSGTAPQVIDPPSGQKTTGWTAGERPPAQYMNWLFWLLDQWVQYLDQQIGSAVLQQTKYNIVDGQAATPLAGQDYDGTVFTSLEVHYEVIRGTDMCNAIGFFQYKSGSWVWEPGTEFGDASGLTFTPSQIGTIGTINVAADIGAGNGTLKIKIIPPYGV